MLTTPQLIECALVRLGRRRAQAGEPSETITVRVWTGCAWEDLPVAVALPSERNSLDLSRFRARSSNPLPAAAALWRGR